MTASKGQKELKMDVEKFVKERDEMLLKRDVNELRKGNYVGKAYR